MIGADLRTIQLGWLQACDLAPNKYLERIFINILSRLLVVPRRIIIFGHFIKYFKIINADKCYC